MIKFENEVIPIRIINNLMNMYNIDYKIIKKIITPTEKKNETN